MQQDETQGPMGQPPSAEESATDTPASGAATVSRRQMLGRMSAVAAAGAAAWVVPEILTAKPAAGATLSGPVTNEATAGSSTPVETVATATTSPHTLAFTGFTLARDVGSGSALVAGGGARHLWASRTAEAAAGGAVGTNGAGADPAQSTPPEQG